MTDYMTAVACVMANWGSVLSAIQMASCKILGRFQYSGTDNANHILIFPLVQKNKPPLLVLLK